MSRHALKKLVNVVLAGFLLLASAACSNSGTGVDVGYDGAGYLPVKLELGVSGYTVSGKATLVTPVGNFSIGAHYNLQPPATNSIYVILRNRKTGYDQIFQIDDGGQQFSAVLNGTTVVTVTKDQVQIDVTNGTIQQISFKKAVNTVAEGVSPTWNGRAWHHIYTRWDEGWAQSWYHPMAMTKWVYSDSSINKWYGVGFVWFIIRLVLAIMVFVVDMVLALGFVVGQAFFILFGPTGRDAIYGLIVLVIVGGSIAAANA